ncbi:hypothetical protein LCGC14_3032970 [marine sediment metagenome]|uniref:Uncharacterized protein n=1 Tax=marine sediment metagenome TaxID=412755 RepID=A0A0F8WRM9_9ZZZZ
MSNEPTMAKKQNAMEMVLDEIDKKLSLVRQMIGQLEERLSVVLLPDDAKDSAVPGIETEGMSLLKQRLTGNVLDMDWAIERVESIIDRLEI